MSKGGIFVEMFIVSLSPANYYTQFFCLEYGDSVPLRLSWLSTSATLWMEIKDITNENTNRNILKYCRFLVLLPPQIAVLEQLVVTMIEKASNWNQILKQSWFSKKNIFQQAPLCIWNGHESHKKGVLLWVEMRWAWTVSSIFLQTKGFQIATDGYDLSLTLLNKTEILIQWWTQNPPPPILCCFHSMSLMPSVSGVLLYRLCSFLRLSKMPKNCIICRVGHPLGKILTITGYDCFLI